MYMKMNADLQALNSIRSVIALPRTQRFWCRKTYGSARKTMWREVEKQDRRENQLIEEIMDLLSACPVSPIVYEHSESKRWPGML